MHLEWVCRVKSIQPGKFESNWLFFLICYFVSFVCLLCFVRQNPLCTHGWPGICCVGQAASEIHLPLFSKSWKFSVYHHIWLVCVFTFTCVFSDSWVSENLESFFFFSDDFLLLELSAWAQAFQLVLIWDSSSIDFIFSFYSSK